PPRPPGCPSGPCSRASRAWSHCVSAAGETSWANAAQTDSTPGRRAGRGVGQAGALRSGSEGVGAAVAGSAAFLEDQQDVAVVGEGVDVGERIALDNDEVGELPSLQGAQLVDRKSTRLNSSHV